jgi:tetratricopeptide (TPR) repeat protein
MKSSLKFLLLILPVLAILSCVGYATSANEYFTIGMSYFELGKYEEAEFWLNRAKAADKTMTASQYNLGRIAFERQRYNEAAGYFEDILKKDPDNALALRAAAYTRIKTGDINIAETHYNRLLEIIPENADDGYNHALVLYAMERYSAAEELLKKYELQMLENNEMQLLFARCQKAQDKAEAIDSYALLLNNKKDAKIRNEYALLLESNELYARALGEYRTALTETEETDSLKREIRFNLARVLLIADSTSAEGITELQAAVNEGYKDITAIEELLKNDKITDANKDSIRNIVNSMQKK